MSNTEQTAGSIGGFGKMLNSVQGLQQRLEDFSIADVSSAEATARTIMLRLKRFQDTIAMIALLKNATANINQSIGEMNQLNIDVVGMDSLENHPQLHAIVKASKLIKLQKLMAALKAGANVGESQGQTILAPATAALMTVELPSNFPSETSDTTGPQPIDKVLSGRQEPSVETAPSLPELEPVSATIDSSSVLETVKKPTITSGPGSDAGTLNIEAYADFPTAEAEFESAIATVAADSPLAQGPLPNSSSPGELLLDNQPTARPPVAEVSTNPPQPAQPKKDSQITPIKKSKSRNKMAGQVDPSKALVPTNESFDLRLLDELVSNYGEFASNPNLPVTVKKTELQLVEPPPNELKEIPPTAPSSAQPAAPAVKRHGDLDRQLKKIIKDYGEYDIYSDKQSTNIKKAGIIAFVFLGLVFGGIYFFKAPPSTAKIAPAASNGSSATVDDRKAQTDAAAINAVSGGNTALDSTQDYKKTPATHK